jgi:integrase
MANPYYKKSHKAWYVKHQGKLIRLGADESGAREAYRKLTSGQYLFGELAVKFLSQKTDATYDYYAKTLLSFSDRKVADLKPYHVTEWLDTFDNPSPTYRHNLMQSIKTCLKWSKDQGYITENPLETMKVPAATSRGDEAYLTPEQWTKLINSVEGDLRDILTFLHETGARPKEARQLQACHLQGQCAILTKEESKGKREPRVIHLSDEALGIVRRLAFKYPKGPIFRNRELAWTSRQLAEKCSSLRLGFPFTAYSLRHSFCTNAILRGVDLVTLASLMGHANLKMISKIYAHVQKRSEHVQAALRKATA